MGLSFDINTEPGPAGRSAGSLAWAGLFNTYFWLDPNKRVTGTSMTQLLPFADDRVLKLFASTVGSFGRSCAVMRVLLFRCGTAKTRYIHPDHLGSTNAVTDESGDVVQTLDYYPYGATRISSGQNAESRQYIGQFSDQSGLSYLQARYMEPSRGQFLSQDPVFLQIGDPNQIQQLTKKQHVEFLSDPQQLNSYSYARGNPITNEQGKPIESRP